MLRAPSRAWSEMMQFINQSLYPGKVSIMFLPILDMNPIENLLAI